MALIEESDLHPAEPAQQPEPRVIIQQAPRSKLVPALLVLLIILLLAIVALTAVVVLPMLKNNSGSPDTEPTAIAELDPSMLMTPTGRKLDAVEFGGYVFEITRLAYSNVPRARSVTITVPGKPPQMGVFHIGESFAGGKVRVVEITGSSVVLEADGQQKVFPILGSDPGEIWDRAPSGTQIIPPTGTGAIPDMPAGQVRAPKDPRTEIPADTTEPGKKPGSLLGNDEDPEDVKGLEDLDLPYIIDVPLARADYLRLVRDMADKFEKDFVLAFAMERDTRAVYGLEIKNIAPSSIFGAHGLLRGDVILSLNDQPVHSIAELTLIARSNVFRNEVRIDIERETGVVTFVFKPGVPD
ncbi:MAG: hypothetical protein H6839_14180 [Planctomycetes bacterium]|nr:hypothetical protein [Planctomycetota bacterium]